MSVDENIFRSRKTYSDVEELHFEAVQGKLGWLTSMTAGAEVAGVEVGAEKPEASPPPYQTGFFLFTSRS